VVSGAVTPDTFILAQDGAVRERTLGAKETRISPNHCGTKVEAVPESEQRRYCFSPVDLAALAGMARRVQEHYGSPQDTEWAISAGKLYLLQARPITTLERDEAAVLQGDIEPQAGAGAMERAEEPLVARPPRGIENIIDHFPEPPLPLDMELIANNAFNLFFEKLGFRPPKEPAAPVERADGRIALRMTEPGLSPAVLWKLPAHFLHVLRTDPIKDWEPLAVRISSWIARLEEERGSTGDAVQLARLVNRSFKEFEPLFARRYLAAFFPGFVYNALVSRWVRRAVGKTETPELENRLYRATPYPTARQNHAMAGLARLGREAGQESAEFQAALDGFLAKWGNRPVRGMIALPSSPTWAEQPEIVVKMVTALLSNPSELDPGGVSESEEQAYRDASGQVETRLNPLYRRWFRMHLERARNALIVREEGLSLSEDYNAFLRRAVLQLGELLAAKGTLADPGDILYLLLSELDPAARGSLRDARARVSRRQQGYQRLLAAYARGQHWLFASGSLPPLGEAQPVTASERKTLNGLGASQGIATGPVRVIRGPEEFGKMRKGEILVAPFTAPAWTPLFRLAAAVVTDIGSQASHAAIVAREYGIPCVVAASGATKTLIDGQLVQVDGARGVINLLSI
jgi:pyruvate,water dikinase